MLIIVNWLTSDTFFENIDYVEENVEYVIYHANADFIDVIESENPEDSKDAEIHIGNDNLHNTV